jgi:hypothetical protein
MSLERDYVASSKQVLQLEQCFKTSNLDGYELSHLGLTMIDTFNQILVYMSSHMIQKGWVNFLVIWINENFCMLEKM